jgi:hypothetical protein
MSILENEIQYHKRCLKTLEESIKKTKTPLGIYLCSQGFERQSDGWIKDLPYGATAVVGDDKECLIIDEFGDDHHEELNLTLNDVKKWVNKLSNFKRYKATKAIEISKFFYSIDENPSYDDYKVSLDLK